MKTSILIFLFYFIIYPIKINFIVPVHMSMVLFPILILLKLKKIYNRKFNFEYSILLLLVSFFYFIIVILNGGKDFYFIKYLIGQLLYIVVSNVIIEYLVVKKRYSIEKILKIIIYCILLDGLTSIIIKLFPDSLYVLKNIIYIPKASFPIMLSNIKTRFIGLGGQFFLGGVIAGYGVIISMYLYLLTQNRKYIILFISCFFSGMLVARTTVISLILSIILLCISGKRKVFKVIFSILLVLFFTIFILLNIDINNKYSYWVLEVLKIFSKDKPQSIVSLIDLIKNIKFIEQEVFLFGNGKWFYSFNEKNIYMTDVGYYRILFYTGIFGLLLFLFYNLFFFIFFIKSTEDSLNKKMIYILMIYFLVLNIKGLVNINPINYFIINTFYLIEIRGRQCQKLLLQNIGK